MISSKWLGCTLAIILVSGLLMLPILSTSQSNNEMIEYDITNGKLLGINVDPEFTSIVVEIKSYGDGYITLKLPRSIIDAQIADGEDDTFIVLVNGDETEAKESRSVSERTLTVPFKAGAKEIEVIGTKVVNLEEIPPAEVPEGETSVGKVVVIFISNETNNAGCSNDDWDFAYKMGNIAWIYLAQYHIPTTLQVLCRSIDDFNAYHPTGIITVYLLDAGQQVPDEGIRYDRDHLVTKIQGKDASIDGVAKWGGGEGDRTYVSTYAVLDDKDYDIDPDRTAWTLSHELSHIALHLLGYSKEVFVDWVHKEQNLCDTQGCDDERIWVGNFVDPTDKGTWYDVMKHYEE